jgi:hypothetical protein
MEEADGIIDQRNSPRDAIFIQSALKGDPNYAATYTCCSFSCARQVLKRIEEIYEQEKDE